MNRKRKRENTKRKNKSEEEDKKYKEEFVNPFNKIKTCFRIAIAKRNSSENDNKLNFIIDDKKNIMDIDYYSIFNINKVNEFSSTCQNTTTNESNDYSPSFVNNNFDCFTESKFIINEIFSNEKEE